MDLEENETFTKSIPALRGGKTIGGIDCDEDRVRYTCIL